MSEDKKIALGVVLALMGVITLFWATSARAAQLDFTTDFFGGAGSSYVKADTDLTDTTCDALAPAYNSNVPLCMEIAQSTYGSPTYGIFVYSVQDSSTPVLNANEVSWAGDLVDGEYYAIVSYNGGGSEDCSGDDISTCISSLGAENRYQTTVCLSVLGGVASEGDCIPPEPPLPTSTVYIISNPNQDFFNGILLFLIGMFGMIYIFKKR